MKIALLLIAIIVTIMVIVSPAGNELTQEQLDAWTNGMLIQDAMPDLTADHREFLISGTTPEMWSKMNE